MNRWIWPISAVLVAVSVVVHQMHASLLSVFVTSCLAIIPLAALMGQSTETIAARVGPRVGGLLSATFGNAVELIIGIFALRGGYLTLVKASITGSIIGNLLFVLGVSFLIGGIRHPLQRFNTRAARSNAAMLVMGIAVAFVVPASFTLHGSHAVTLSAATAVVLFCIYAAGLLFSLFTHSRYFEYIHEEETSASNSTSRFWLAALVLCLATALVSMESDWLVAGVKQVGHSLGWGQMFIGVVVVAVVGNAAEHVSAVWMAWKDRMDLSLEIAVGSTLQVAMFVAPLLFFVSWGIGHTMPLVFTWPELVSMGASVLLVVVLMNDGESNWLEGAMAVGAYLIMAVGFYTL
ncbi:calcium/proton exchanger [Alicyclobacillus sp. ALC3]|uniref:calcium/proton exchanger n=1 Tax=Alicyclobacillus sp. ALC3 TaxID=2796143 RepID=UPI002378E737|nr:calcium/proton exchanger [Alicyclobacillus sp. ALC3]WDL96878.1 calcium/proton exchanger [Alicyclobacillus sp. ALC3]